MKNVLIIFFSLLCSDYMYAQGTDEENRVHDSLVSLNNNKKTKTYRFTVYEKSDDITYPVLYTCKVNHHSIVNISRTFKRGRKSGNEGDTLEWKDEVMLYNGKLLEFYHMETTSYFTYADDKIIVRSGGERSTGTAWFNAGKLYYAFTDGHDLDGYDGWDAQGYAEQQLEEMLKAVKKKYPKWK